MPSRSRPWIPVTERTSSPRIAFATFYLVVASLIFLPIIAFASPPDPVWIPGIFDGADGDDVVTLIYETAAACPSAGPHILPPRYLQDMTGERVICAVFDDSLTHVPRAPPLSPILETSSPPNSGPLAVRGSPIPCRPSHSRNSLPSAMATLISIPSSKADGLHIRMVHQSSIGRRSVGAHLFEIANWA